VEVMIAILVLGVVESIDIHRDASKEKETLLTTSTITTRLYSVRCNSSRFKVKNQLCKVKTDQNIRLRITYYILHITFYIF